MSFNNSESSNLMSFFLNRISLVMKPADKTLLISKQITKVVAARKLSPGKGITIKHGLRDAILKQNKNNNPSVIMIIIIKPTAHKQA